MLDGATVRNLTVGAALGDASALKVTASDGTYTMPVTDDNQPVALQAARYALATPFAVTDMSPGTQTPGNGIEDTDFENDSNKE